MTTDTALALLAEAEDAICILSDSIRDETVSEYYSNLRDRITALLDSGGWMPIETAPKDGKGILICRTGFDCVVSARWSTHYDQWSTGSGPMAFFAEPTHWQPLPPLPKGDIK